MNFVSRDLMESARNNEVDFDIDDPYDSSTMLSTDLSQEEIIKIMEMTKKKPPPTLPLLHYKSNKLQNAELSKIFVILKYPGTNKYLLFDSLNFFLLQGGRHDCLKEETTIASLIAKKCFNIFTAFKRNGTFTWEAIKLTFLVLTLVKAAYIVLIFMHLGVVLAGS